MISEKLKKMTISNLLIVPILGIPRKILDQHGLINSYLYNKEEEQQMDYVIHLLFFPSNMEEFNDFLEKQRMDGREIIQEKDFNNGLILITFPLTKDFDDDYKKIWKGEYSKISYKYRLKVPAVIDSYDVFGRKSSTMSLQHRIFNKEQELKKEWEDEFNMALDSTQELWRKPSVENETFDINNHVISIKTTI